MGIVDITTITVHALFLRSKYH